MKRPYKVRFNLGTGRNYMKWKIEGLEEVSYYSPNDVNIVMTNCQLKNQKKIAQKIFEGANKTVCAWVKCESLVVKENKIFDEESAIEIKYNPRVFPNWFIGDGENVDNMIINTVFSSGRKLFTFKN